MAIGITFDETMSGGFSLDIEDPREGARRGRDTRLSMHATVTVPDLDAFLADPDHAGGLTGTIDYAGFGGPVTARSGVFRLFSPTSTPGLKHMVYELGFEHGGRPRYLAGRKLVHDDPGFDLWSDTTTLYTTLHEGKDGDAAVIGAGTLRLDMGDFLRLMSTIRVTGTTSAARQAEAVARFGRFFMGELWSVYGPGA